MCLVLKPGACVITYLGSIVHLLSVFSALIVSSMCTVHNQHTQICPRF